MVNKDTKSKISWWHFGIAFLIMLGLSAYLLRQNNLKMLELRDKVVEIDQESGDIKKIEPALADLRDYVLTHMNASLPAPLELPGSFNVAVEQARRRAEASGSANSSIYAKAQAECENVNVPLSVRAQCIQNYVLSNAKPGEEPTGLDLPPKEQFVYNFVSPRISFDLAGISVLATSALLIATLTTLFLQVIFPKITSYITKQPLE